MKTTPKTDVKPAPLRVVVMDPQEPTRFFLRTGLAERPGFHVAEEGRTGPEAVRLCVRLEPDLLILETELPEIGGAAVLGELRERGLETRTLVYTGSRHEEVLADTLRARPHGLVHKDEPAPTLWQALDLVAHWGAFISPVFGPFQKRAAADTSTCQLSPRQREIMQMAAEGLPNKTIGERLSVTAKTVERERANLMKKLGVLDFAALVRVAVRKGMVP